MLALFIGFALAKPAPYYIPKPAPTLYGAPILSAGVRGTLRTSGPESAGVEARLDSPLFVRMRLSGGRSITRTQFDSLQEIIGFPGERPWWGRQLSLEAAWAPLPNLRIGGALTDHLQMTRGRNDFLQINIDTRGQTTLGPTIAAGVFNDRSSLHFGSGYRVPVAVKRSQVNRVTTDAVRQTVADITSPQYFFELEGRICLQSWVGSAEVNVSRARRSRALQDMLPPDAQQANWGDWQPRISLGLSRMF